MVVAVGAVVEAAGLVARAVSVATEKAETAGLDTTVTLTTVVHPGCRYILDYYTTTTCY